VRSFAWALVNYTFTAKIIFIRSFTVATTTTVVVTAATRFATTVVISEAAD
jgi:hypothetical protein